MDKKQLDAQIARTWSAFREVAERAQAEERRGGVSAETRWSLDSISAAIDKLEAAMEKRAHPGELARDEAEQGSLTLNGAAYTYQRGTPQMHSFVKLLRGGVQGVPDSQRDRLPLADLTAEQKAMALLDDTTGGYLAPPEMASDLLRVMTNISPVRRAVTVVPVGAGASLVPVRAGVQTARRISEAGTRVATPDPTFRAEQIPTHEMYAEDVVSRALLLDSAYPLDVELTDAASRAFAKLEGAEFISGTGNGEMLGLDAATLPTANVVTCADSTGHTVAPDDLLRLLNEGLPAAYMDGAQLLLNPKVLSKLRQAKATSGTTYLLPVVDLPGTLAGVRYIPMPDLPDNATPAAGRNVMYLVHPQAYRLVVRMEVTVVRLAEKFAEQGQIGFYIFTRTGGQPVDTAGIARLVTA